jgi:MFS family permease
VIGLLRHGDYRRLWGAQTVSQFGSQISQLALPLVAVIGIEASTFSVALLWMFELLPFLLFALPAGVWVDRLPRRPILVVADAGRAVALGSVPLVAAVSHVTIWQLYAVGFVTGVLTVFFDVAYQSYLPSLVEPHQLMEGNAKLELSRSAAQVGGPGIGGVLVEAITAPYAVAVDAVSFVWSALLLGRIRTTENPPARSAERSMIREIREGLRYLLGDPRWRAITTNVFVFNLGTGMTGPLFLVYGVRRLDLSPGELGLVFSVGNVGWLVGAVVAGRATRRVGAGRMLIAGSAIAGAPLFLWPLAPHDYAIPVVATGWALTAFGIVLFNIPGISLYQTLVPRHILGRMNASRRWIVWGVTPLGNVLGGALASGIGLRTTMFAGCAVSSVAFLFLLSKPVRSLATVDVDAGAPGDGSVAAPAR